ncbi:hypothetical protein J2S13_002634 [Oikeobacillus pervagus]|uniref:Peptide ABC transporter permease n=1 Tax=Oikeobacillus pervagus TaxID=1325931 RepID=A0AAJ1T0U6_9BACI|nr:anti-sigma-F factor Fin family protein [Oikeobacillus pervagus]MDQ0216194.1 hypothetical protein [Oikeobacillus pervagus]
MAIHYRCRHCGTNIGSIDQSAISTEQLGLQLLSTDERKEMVQYERNGDVNISTICEDCQESLERNPEFHQYDYFIH